MLLTPLTGPKWCKVNILENDVDPTVRWHRHVCGGTRSSHSQEAQTCLWWHTALTAQLTVRRNRQAHGPDTDRSAHSVSQRLWVQVRHILVGCGCTLMKAVGKRIVAIFHGHRGLHPRITANVVVYSCVCSAVLDWERVTNIDWKWVTMMIIVINE